MINYIYQLISPGVFSIKYCDENFKNKVIIRPSYMAICHADQRYYMGQRNIKILNKKLPMSLIHECCGRVIFDETNTYKKGQKVVLIPNVPPDKLVNGIYENYAKGSRFLSSGYDGFMREFICLPPDRVVTFNNIDLNIAAICEFVSVGVHAVRRLKKIIDDNPNNIGIWGDGSLAYTVCCCLKSMIPSCKVFVIGKNINKLSQFILADDVYMSDDLPQGFKVDSAFECAGGEGSFYAIDDIIKYISPQGKIMLLGVSENRVPIKTRDVLEKGLTIVGCSRSGRKDFEIAVNLMENFKFQRRLSNIIIEDKEVSCVDDIHRVFGTDLNTPFKTVFKWSM